MQTSKISASRNLWTFSVTSELPAQGHCSNNDICTPSTKRLLRRPLPTSLGATPHMLSGKSSASLRKSWPLLIPFGLSPRGCTLLLKLKCTLPVMLFKILRIRRRLPNNTGCLSLRKLVHVPDKCSSNGSVPGTTNEEHSMVES